LSLSASEKIAKPEKVPSLFEVENILTPIDLKHWVDKVEFLGLRRKNKLRDKWKLKDLSDLLVKFLTKDNISRSQLYPFFKGIYKLCRLILRCLYTLSFLQRWACATMYTHYILRIGYCDIFNLELLSFFQEPAFPATRVHLTISLAPTSYEGRLPNGRTVYSLLFYR